MERDLAIGRVTQGLPFGGLRAPRACRGVKPPRGRHGPQRRRDAETLLPDDLCVSASLRLRFPERCARELSGMLAQELPRARDVVFGRSKVADRQSEGDRAVQSRVRQEDFACLVH